MACFNLSKSMKNLIYVFLWASLTGCANESFDDLKEYVAQVKAKPATAIEPMPAIKSYESYIYVAEGLRNPFQPLEEPQTFEGMTSIEGPGPDLNREKEELEAYPLDTLRMVGTLSRGGDLWGLVKANDGVIHRVQAGHYLGQNYGKIMSIQEQKIDIGEWVNASAGLWQERDASLALIE